MTLTDKEFEKTTATNLRALILSAPGLATFMPPELRFGSPKVLDKALAQLDALSGLPKPTTPAKKGKKATA